MNYISKKATVDETYFIRVESNNEVGPEFATLFEELYMSNVCAVEV